MKRKKTGCSLLGIVILVTAVLPQNARAQQGEDIARGLLRALIESQLDKSRRRNNVPPDPFRPANGRGTPGRTQLTPEMQQLRPIAASVAHETATLVALLQTDARRSSDIRRRLPDAIRLQANAAALQQRSAAQNNHAVVLDDFRSFNSDWSTFSHQLQQSRAISSQTSACLQRIGALDTQYCSLLGFQEQFDSQELVRAAYTLSTYIRDLVDDVQDRPAPGNAHRQLLKDLANFSQTAEYFATLVSRGTSYQAAVSEYRDVYGRWTAIENRLGPYSGHSIARSVRRIRDSNRIIHELLRLKTGIDKNLVLQLVHTVDHELDELFRTITLEQLMTLPDSQAVPDAADALYGTIQNLDDLVHRDETPQSIAEGWVYADDAFKQFLYYIGSINNAATAGRLRTISDTMNSLKQTLGVTVEYDRDALVKNASSLEFLAEHLVDTIRKWQQHPGSHDRSLLTRAQQLVNAFHSLEQSLASRRNRAPQHRQQCDQAIAIWQQIRPVLKTCETDERGQLDHIVSTLTPELVRLRTMLDE